MNDENKLLKIDIENLHKRITEIEKDIQKRNQFLLKNITQILLVLDRKLIYPKKCAECEGKGIKYISPISDCGQDNKCDQCYGKGEIWL